MATYEEAMQALRAADAAGNAEDARKLAQVAQRLRSAEPRESAGADVFRAFNTGIARGVGLPVDLGTLALRTVGADISPNQVGGGDFLRNLGARVGLTFPSGREPANLVERAAQEVGTTAVPTAGILARGRAVKDAGNAVDRMAQEAAKRPGRTAAFEGASAVSAATGGEVARQFSDSPEAVAIGELLGGFAPTAALSGPAAAAARKAKQGVQAAIFPFTEAGGKIRASRAVQGLVEDPERAVARLRGADILSDVGLSPARRIGEGRLLAMERAVLNEDPALDAKFSQALADANVATRQEALQFQGDPKRTKRLLAERRDHLLGLIDTRAAVAAKKAQEAAAQLGPQASARETSRTVRTQIEGALKDARADERRLWGEIQSDATASVANAQQTLVGHLASRGRFSDPGDIPEWLEDALRGAKPKDTKFLYVPGATGMEKRVIDARKPTPMTVKDITDLRGRVLDEMAIAKSGATPNRQKARILDDVQEALLEDLKSVDDPAIKTAIDFSRKLNDKFTRGAVGKVLGYDRARGFRVDPTETMEALLSGSPIRSARKVEQLLTATPDARQNVETHLRSRFVEQATEKNVVDRRAAAHFLERHGVLLDQFPQLRASLEGAKQAQDVAERVAGRAATLRDNLYDKRVSRAALYLDGPVGDEIGRVMGSDDPVRAMAQLKRQARRDPMAVQGLKQTYIEDLLRQSRTSDVDEAGEIITSGKRFRKLLSENRDISRVLLAPAEMDRMNRVAATLARIEAKPVGKQVVIGDAASNILDLAARWLGAQTGQRIAKGTGASLVMAGEVSKRYSGLVERLTTDKAKRLIVEAVQDPVLFEALMVGPTASAARQKTAIQRVNAWLASPSATAAEDPVNTDRPE